MERSLPRKRLAVRSPEVESEDTIPPWQDRRGIAAREPPRAGLKPVRAVQPLRAIGAWVCSAWSSSASGGWRSGGVTMPPETTILMPSSTDISRWRTALRGRNSRKPEVGFGVVGRKMLTDASGVSS